ITAPEPRADATLQSAARLEARVTVAATPAAITSLLAGSSNTLVLGGDGTSASGRPWSGRVNAVIRLEREDETGWRSIVDGIYRLDLSEKRVISPAHFVRLPGGRYRTRLDATAFTEEV